MSADGTHGAEVGAQCSTMAGAMNPSVITASSIIIAPQQ